MLTGDIDKLGRIGSAIASLSEVPTIAAELVSDRIAALVQLEFDAGVDPYGEAWAPLAPATVARGRHAPPLTDSGEMRASLLVYPSFGTVRASIGTSQSPAGPHQDGWSGPQGSGPARPILPSAGDMPDSWAMAIEDATIDAVALKMREARAG